GSRPRNAEDQGSGNHMFPGRLSLVEVPVLRPLPAATRVLGFHLAFDGCRKPHPAILGFPGFRLAKEDGIAAFAIPMVGLRGMTARRAISRHWSYRTPPEGDSLPRVRRRTHRGREEGLWGPPPGALRLHRAVEGLDRRGQSLALRLRLLQSRALRAR